MTGIGRGVGRLEGVVGIVAVVGGDDVVSVQLNSPSLISSRYQTLLTSYSLFWA